MDGQEKLVRLTRIHMEEDAGKNLHDVASDGSSGVDLNRAGVPLIEIVSEPDLRSADEAVEYLKALRAILLTLGVSDGNMEEGSFRCDANVSVMRKGATQFGTRAEIKNMNSFRYVKQAIEYEMRRQVELVEAGQPVVQETRLYDPARGETRSMRSKEEAHDYRYFPEPDLPPVRVDEALVARMRAEQPELPRARAERYQRELGLSAQDAGVLVGDGALADFFDAALCGARRRGRGGQEGGQLAHRRAVPAHQRDRAAAPGRGSSRRPSWPRCSGWSTPARSTAPGPSCWWRSSSGTAATRPSWCGAGAWPRSPTRGPSRRRSTPCWPPAPAEVERHRSGKKDLTGFFVGQVMKALEGKGNPGVVNALLKKKLGGG